MSRWTDSTRAGSSRFHRSPDAPPASPRVNRLVPMAPSARTQSRSVRSASSGCIAPSSEVSGRFPSRRSRRCVPARRDGRGRRSRRCRSSAHERPQSHRRRSATVANPGDPRIVAYGNESGTAGVSDCSSSHFASPQARTLLTTRDREVVDTRRDGARHGIDATGGRPLGARASRPRSQESGPTPPLARRPTGVFKRARCPRSQGAFQNENRWSDRSAHRRPGIGDM